MLLHSLGATTLALAGVVLPIDASGLQGRYMPDHSARQYATIVLDASRFLDEIQKDHTITDAASLRVSWLFNNTGLVLRSRSNYVIRVDIPEPGTYHLYTRSHGTPSRPASASGPRTGSLFRIALGDTVAPVDLGDEPLRFERVGVFQLEKGETDVRIMRIEPSPVLDVLVLSTNPDFVEDDLLAWQFHEEVALLRSYAIPRSSVVKFGDLTGDGRMDLVALARDFSARAFDHDGNELWSYDAPAEGRQLRSSFEPPGLIWDLDSDGSSEVIHWRMMDDEEWLVVAEGSTGRIVHRNRWPTRPLPHEYNNFRLAIGRLDPGYPDDIIAFTDMGGTISITAYDGLLNQRWQHTESRLKDHLGHYPYPVDLVDDDIDEVLVGPLLLDARGNEVWSRFDLFFDNHDHADSYRFADLDHDGELEIVSSHSEVGVVVLDAANGDIVWQNTAEHAQQVEAGDFLDGAPGPHVAIGARTYGNREAGEPYLWSQVWWFDRDGRLVTKWPGRPLNGNPEIVKGDWRGDGREALFWYRFRMQRDGSGVLYFGEPVYHMFDFMGDSAEEVMTLDSEHLRVYGYRHADHERAPARKGPDYMRRVANHTHY